MMPDIANVHSETKSSTAQHRLAYPAAILRLPPDDGPGITLTHINIIRSSFRILVFEKDRFAEMFYARLIALDPEIKNRFPRTTMGVQRNQLLLVLGMIVDLLDDAPTLKKTLADLARRHAIYGASDPRFLTARTALAWAIDRTLDPSIGPSVQAAWIAGFNLVTALLSGARPQV